jgi:glycosyltransferase involved in cell wall biosynthesis
MRFSIALATFNGDKFLRRQLVSLAEQTLMPAELVVTDDGSRDDTLAILEKFSKTAPFPVHVHHNEERLGYRANRYGTRNFTRAATPSECATVCTFCIGPAN